MQAPQDLFKALSDQTRLSILALVTTESELCVCELVCALQQSQPKISRHLKLLREQALLEDRRQGVWVYYRLHPDLPGWIRDILRITTDASADLTAPCLTRLRAMGDRPQRQSSCC
ncbi:MAG: metalloregulator ArsR/SmtB family transcription factor [Ketobacteraceae bacterium]|nr:metalloregulator ArsR/SmtB family transcription factor [Ketobacteraceae bacterium]